MQTPVPGKTPSAYPPPPRVSATAPAADGLAPTPRLPSRPPRAAQSPSAATVPPRQTAHSPAAHATPAPTTPPASAHRDATARLSPGWCVLQVLQVDQTNWSESKEKP